MEVYLRTVNCLDLQPVLGTRFSSIFDTLQI